MDGHYDRATDIARLRLEGWAKDRMRVEETGSGLVERDRSTGRVISLEFWQTSTRLPAERLDALPAPPRPDVAIERQPA